MNLKKIGFLNALGTTAYVCLIVLGMYNAERIFPEEDTVLIPISMLLLFVLSATITASLVLGRPILMHLNGAKVEAVRLFLYTVGWLAAFTIIFLGLNIV